MDQTTALLKTADWWHQQTRVPPEVAQLVLEDGLRPAKAWRLHLQLTQREVAAPIGVTRAAYWNLENNEKPRNASRLKIAAARALRKVNSTSEPV